MNEQPSPVIAAGDTIAVTGATGYVGGRLVPALLEAGYRVRCLVREPRKLDARPWRNHPRVEVFTNDLDDTAAVAADLRGCRAAYYLVHSMVATGGAYADHDRKLAARFAGAARDAGVSRIIYLGGLGEMGPDLSEHLRSRRQVEEELASCGVPVTTFRGPRATGVHGCWDAARTAVYVSVAGLGLLGRAVHCNCGRPSLWAFLPLD